MTKVKGCGDHVTTVSGSLSCPFSQLCGRSVDHLTSLWSTAYSSACITQLKINGPSLSSMIVYYDIFFNSHGGAAWFCRAV